MNKSFQLIAFLPLLLSRIWCILYAAELNHNNDWLVWDSKNHPEVYCFWLERQSNDLALLWPSAMKASISSTVRGTHVSSSIPLAVTAMSSSIRTCHREDTVTKVFQLGMRSASGSDSGGSTRDISVCGGDVTPGRATYCNHGNCPSPPAPWCGALYGPVPLGPPPWDHTSSVVTPAEQPRRTGGPAGATSATPGAAGTGAARCCTRELMLRNYTGQTNLNPLTSEAAKWNFPPNLPPALLAMAC